MPWHGLDSDGYDLPPLVDERVILDAQGRVVGRQRMVIDAPHVVKVPGTPLRLLPGTSLIIGGCIHYLWDGATFVLWVDPSMT
jgi:hypothetical protein